MNLSHIVSFGLKLSHLLLLSFYWFLFLISLNSLSNGRIMTTKTKLRGDGEHMWVKLRECIYECGRKIHQHYSHYFGFSKVNRSWWRKVLIAWIVSGMIASVLLFWFMSSHAVEKRKETLASMCDERARMLQDQFNVSMNHIQAMSVMISIFHHGKNPSAIDQRTFARYTDKTAFERPLTSGVAYAVRVLHSERDQFEIQQGWTIKRMDHSEQTPVHEDEYDPADLEPSPDQEEYAPVIFAQDTVAHVISVDMLSGKEDRENVLRARESGKGVLTAPFRLLKTNRLGVILTFAVYKRDLSPNATPAERIQATAGYLGGIFDIESLVEKLLQQLASKQTILVNVFDTTDSSEPISMYGANTSTDGLQHVSALNFGDPFRKHEMHCRFKQKPPLPWLAILASVGTLVIDLLVGQIIHATVNRIATVEDDWQQMAKLKIRAEAADDAKSQFLATVSHEIRTPMNGVLGMLQMLMDTDLDETQQDYVRTARESGKALVSLINEVLDLAKIESGKLELEEVCFDLRSILDDVLSLFSGKSQDKNVELAAYVSDKVPNTLVGDPWRFRQIITNLVGNSIKFTDKGHIFVTVHLVEEVSDMDVESDPCSSLSGLPVVDRRQSWAKFKVFNQEAAAAANSEPSPPSPSLSADPNQITVIVSVEDTGQGIPLEAQSRIFDPFMQVGPSITRTHGGTGIGLSISKCLVHLMKGEIGLASSPQVGSTFTFTAAFASGRGSVNNNPSAQQVQNVQSGGAVSSEFRGMTALVMDPKPIRAKVSKYHIERLGVKVKVVSNLDSGLSISSLSGSKTRDKAVSLVFIEEDYWDKDLGASVLSLNDNSSRTNNNSSVDTRIFLLSNRAATSTRSALHGPGPYVITKPLRASMLAASIQRAMGISSRGNHRNGELHHTSLSNLLRGRKVLVVDDNTVNLRVASGALRKYGADVAHAERGKDAISLLTPPHRFDACFMDIQMPEMDGFEATRRIREIERTVASNGDHAGEESAVDHRNGSTWHVPILAMTADVSQKTHDECVTCGMDGYVPKPFEAEQLYREVSRFFQTVAKENQ